MITHSPATLLAETERDLQMLQAVIAKPSSAPEQSNSDGDAECFEIARLPPSEKRV